MDTIGYKIMEVIDPSCNPKRRRDVMMEISVHYFDKRPEYYMFKAVTRNIFVEITWHGNIIVNIEIIYD